MAGGLRFRSEANLVSSLGSPYLLAGSPLQIVPALTQANTPLPNAIARIGVYRLVIEALVTATIQFQDNLVGGSPATTLLSAQYNLTANGFLILDTPINGDPWWQCRGGAG